CQQYSNWPLYSF
nr:immunoglobulin light chain junction region [Macaca mulatta]MOX87635.1 immunoglobulin light chain junction region [Macaca mulatta]MOX88138.1 immunoglobulin light chain junction region [Macaca mulatta]MOX88271.1 immunoglobulin light chain junction region [Macaca mulatta]MOX89011.1 immunoglobulin light chain junction region [Macaca mulatta]